VGSKRLIRVRIGLLASKARPNGKKFGGVVAISQWKELRGRGKSRKNEPALKRGPFEGSIVSNTGSRSYLQLLIFYRGNQPYNLVIALEYDEVKCGGDSLNI